MGLQLFVRGVAIPYLLYETRDAMVVIRHYCHSLICYPNGKEREVIGPRIVDRHPWKTETCNHLEEALAVARSLVMTLVEPRWSGKCSTPFHLGDLHGRGAVNGIKD